MISCEYPKSDSGKYLVPQCEKEIIHFLSDPIARVCSGFIYKIMVKSDSGDGDFVVPFIPNLAQVRLISNMHHRNIILKARQLGFTTLTAILWLDHALFNADQRCGIIAQDREAAESIFKDKVKFAYERLPEFLLERMPLEKDSATELRFAHNNSAIRVATSMRSGTIHRLHISEFGKICAKYPDKANEVVTGSIPAVPTSGILIIESTAEGREGEFFKMTDRAKAQQQTGKKLGPKDYRFHFFAWWQEPGYAIDPEGMVLTEKIAKYFSEIESKIGQALSDRQRAWYVATMESDFSGDQEKMYQEYPSTPEEAFQVSTEGCFYAEQMATARKEGRILRIPLASGPVNTFWDLGHSGQSDATGLWFHQRVGMENRFLRYKEWSLGETLNEYVRYLQSTGYVFGKHYLPHDAGNKRLGSDPDKNRSIVEMLEELLPTHKFELVDRVTSIHTGIQAVRNVFPSCYFDEEGCKEGLDHLSGYRKEWDEKHGVWRSTPRHDEHSHGSDAFRQFGQESDAGNMFRDGYGSSKKKQSSGGWRTA
jgi:hypothetical protein